ncbi:MAG: hypothetical protein ACD_7C00114G0003 [uncultured bacterium]|nr:MAG: hypothetical protein ACD_7C00114G0003 [uncultured bacterium]
MPKTKLNKPPLVEVVFEIKFKDPKLVNYDLLVGELYSKLKNKYPIAEPLKPQEIPSLLMPFMVQHRFRTNKDGYPLYQLGPGIVSFNVDGATYGNGWTGFKKELLFFIKAYSGILKDDFSSDNFERVSLRYIDKIEDPRMYPEVKEYFDNVLKTEINLKFSENSDNFSKLEDTSLSQTYQIDDESKLFFKLRTITDGSRKLLLDSSVITTNLQDINNLNAWLNKAHDSLSDLFVKLTVNLNDLFE